MTPPKKEDLDRILKFCATCPRSAPSPPLRRGEVYCLSSFPKRAEQWYKEEAGRQLTQRSRDAAAVGKRRQPSRAAKGSFEPGDYVLPEDEVGSLFPQAASPQRHTGDGNGPKTTRHETGGLLTPPADVKEDKDGGSPRGEPPGHAAAQGPEAQLIDLRARLSRAIHNKDQELRARHDREGGVRHTCTVGGAGWDCVDEEYCGHGLVERCMRWVPKGKAHLRARVRSEMEAFFSSGGSSNSSSSDKNDGDGGSISNNNSPNRLAELKKGRAAALRAETMRRMADIEARLLSAAGAGAAVEAEMLESPTLGRWPADSAGFPREDVGEQRVELAGLAFAVDVCVGETRVLML